MRRDRHRGEHGHRDGRCHAEPSQWLDPQYGQHWDVRPPAAVRLRGASLTINTAKFDFGLSAAGSARLAVTGSASVSGTNIIDIGVLGTSLMTGTYPLITASSGLNYGAFDFDVNGTMTTTRTSRWAA